MLGGGGLFIQRRCHGEVGCLLDARPAAVTYRAGVEASGGERVRADTASPDTTAAPIARRGVRRGGLLACGGGASRCVRAPHETSELGGRASELAGSFPHNPPLQGPSLQGMAANMSPCGTPAPAQQMPARARPDVTGPLHAFPLLLLHRQHDQHDHHRRCSTNTTSSFVERRIMPHECWGHVMTGERPCREWMFV